MGDSSAEHRRIGLRGTVRYDRQTRRVRSDLASRGNQLDAYTLSSINNNILKHSIEVIDCEEDLRECHHILRALQSVDTLRLA